MHLVLVKNEEKVPSSTSFLTLFYVAGSFFFFKPMLKVTTVKEE